MKKYVLCMMLAASALLTGCRKDGGGAVPTVTLTLANNLPADSCTSRAIDWFAGQVKERSGGRIEIQVYHDSALGDSPSCLEQMQYGSIDMVKTDEAVMANYVPDYYAFAMPYIYQDTEHFRKVHEGDIGMGLLRGEAMAAGQMYGLTYYDGGSRGFFSKRQICSPEDMKGMLVRVQGSRLMMAMVEALGANPVALEYDQIFGELQTGGVAAAENSLVNYMQDGFYEAAPCFIEDGHTRNADMLVMSSVIRAKLSEADLKMIDETALESWEYQQKLWDEAEEQTRRELEDRQAVVYMPDEQEMDAFRSACEPVWSSYDDGAYIDMIDRIVAAGRM
ncbi:MAG: TRAP transporter substrate-binding protein DctP [Eubacteriales bacterium]|nr:TRAP transporter substrate-binding protein DctP [Eubacteriales bacterium]